MRETTMGDLPNGLKLLAPNDGVPAHPPRTMHDPAVLRAIQEQTAVLREVLTELRAQKAATAPAASPPARGKRR